MGIAIGIVVVVAAAGIFGAVRFWQHRQHNLKNSKDKRAKNVDLDHDMMVLKVGRKWQRIDAGP